MTPREKHLAEIERVKAALNKTTSPKLRHDYGRHLKRMYAELKYYDKVHMKG